MSQNDLNILVNRRGFGENDAATSAKMSDQGSGREQSRYLHRTDFGGGGVTWRGNELKLKEIKAKN